MKKEYVEDRKEEVVLTVFICSNASCISGNVLSDSRDQDRISSVIK